MPLRNGTKIVTNVLSKHLSAIIPQTDQVIFGKTITNTFYINFKTAHFTSTPTELFLEMIFTLFC